MPTARPESEGGDETRREHAIGSPSSLIGIVVAVCSRHAFLVVLIAALIGAGALAYVALHFAIDTDTTKLIAEDEPWRQRELAFDAAFPHRGDLIAIVVDAATPELAEGATTTIARRIAGRHELFHAVWRPDGGPFFERNGLLFQSTGELTRMTQRLIEAQPLLGSLAADPSLRGLMGALSLVADGASHDATRLDALVQPLGALADAFETVAAGQTPAFSWRALIDAQRPDPRELRRFILAQPVLDYRALQPGARATDAIRQTVSDVIGHDNYVRVRLTGPVPLADEELATLADGALVNASAMAAAIVALLGLALRSARLVLATLSSLVIGLIATAAFGLLAFGSFNLISVAFAVLFVGLGVDFGIQYCVCYRAERHRHDDLLRALHDAGKKIGGALALAAAAVAVGFYSFLPTAYRGIAALGAISGTGMIIAFVATITLLPALLAALRPPAERADVGFESLATLDRFLLTHRHGVLLLAIGIALGSLSLLPKLTFDFDPLHLRSDEVESVATLHDLMRDPRTTPYAIDVLATSLADAASLAQRVESLPEVDHAITLASFVPEQQNEKLALIADAALLLDPVLNPMAPNPPASDADNVRAMKHAAQRLGDAAAAHPGHAGAIALSRLARVTTELAGGEAGSRRRLETALMPAWATTLDQLRSAMQATPVTLATLPDDLKRDWIAADGRARVEIFPTGNPGDNDTLRRFVTAVRGVAPAATGPPVSILDSSRTIISAFVQAGCWALLSITFLLSITLRRFADVLRALAPLALSALVTLAICAAIGLPLNFENVIALPLLLGIGVAFDIYFVVAWRAGRSQVLQSSLARAVIFSALTTGAGFGSLWLSHHPGTSSMGKVLALSLACTLAATLLFLPAVLGSPRRD